MPVLINTGSLKYKDPNTGEFIPLNQIGDDLESAIAPKYSELTFPVSKGSLCFQNGSLYIAKQAITTTEAWTPDHWEETTVEEVIANKADIDDTAGAGVTNKAWSADKLTGELDAKAPKANPEFTSSISLGRKANTTVGKNSVATGNVVEASGNASHAEGMGTASGTFSHAEGSGTASGVMSHAGGANTIANSLSQSTFGEYNVADPGFTSAGSRGTYVEIVGNGTANGRSNARTLDWQGNERLMGDLYVNCNTDSTGGTKLLSETDVPIESGTGASSAKMKDYVRKGTVYSNTASGEGAFAEGIGTTASDIASHSEGRQTVSSNTGSHSEGINSVASGYASHAEGGNSEASGTHSHAEGRYTVASGGGSHSEGTSTIANALKSHASGSFNIEFPLYPQWEKNKEYAVGDRVTVDSIGCECAISNSDSTFDYNKWKIIISNSDAAMIVGNGNGDDARSNAYTLDWDGTAHFAGDVYIDCNPDSTGGTALGDAIANKADKANPVFTSSVSMGRKAGTAVGANSVALGYSVEASGWASFAEGSNTISAGDSSHTEGDGPKATGYAAHAQGDYTEAKGYASHVEGSGTIATGNYSHVSGTYNVVEFDYDQLPLWDASVNYAVGDRVKDQFQNTTYYIAKVANKNVSLSNTGTWEAHWYNGFAEIVGNGESENARSNARTLDWNGNEELAGDLTIKKGSADEVSVSELADDVGDLKSAIKQNTPEMFGAVGDGVTDDSQAIQDAIDAGYDVYFSSNKTYYLASEVLITKDCHLHGGRNTVIKQKKPTGNEEHSFHVAGTLKKTTTLTTDYSSTGSTANSANQFTLTDMSGIEIGDILVITAEDQYYSYARQYYYLGATLLVSDIYDGHIYTSNSMPFDIENTQNVSVKVYHAPIVNIDNLNFVSDISDRSRMWFDYCILLEYCKNSNIKNCNLTEFDIGIGIKYCVNTLIDNVSISKSKYDNNLQSDGYGIYVISSTNTIIQRVLAICAQGCLDLGGYIPCFDTFVKECNLSSECRTIGIDLHENNYNIVIEDCTVGGMSLFGTATVNRCRIIQNKRAGGDRNSIVFRGSHDPRWAKVRITNCVFDGKTNTGISLNHPAVQTPIQSFDNIIDSVEIENCTGGSLNIVPDITTDITANIINRLFIKNWKNCYEIYRNDDNTISDMEVVDSTFEKKYWINDHSHSAYAIKNINMLRVNASAPLQRKIFVDLQKYGGKYILPEGIDIAFSSTSQSERYAICGSNFASNILADYEMGNIGGNVGQAMTRTPNATFSNSLSLNQNGNLVISYPTSTSIVHLFAKYSVYVSEWSRAQMSCTFKNIGTTNGAGFRLYIITIDCSTGLIISKTNSDLATADATGATITCRQEVAPNSLVLCYVACSGPVSNSITELVEFVSEINPFDMDGTISFTPYNGKGLTGDGILQSIEGLNNIMSSANKFDAVFKVDNVLNSGAGVSATGVNF